MANDLLTRPPFGQNETDDVYDEPGNERTNAPGHATAAHPEGTKGPTSASGESVTEESDVTSAAKSEEKGESAPQEQSLYNHGGNNGDDDKENKALKRAGQRISKFAKKHKLMVIGSVGGAAAVVGILILLLLSSLIIPNLVNHMIAYGFANSAEDTADSVLEVDAENTAIDTSRNNVLQDLVQKYAPSIKSDLPNTMGAVLTKFNQFRPQKVFNNIKLGTTYVYSDNPLISIPVGNGQVLEYQRLKSIILPDGTEIATPTTVDSLTSLVKNPVDYFKGVYNSKNDLKAALTDESISSGGGKIIQWFVRSKVMDKIYNDIDANRFRWTKTVLDKDENADSATAQAEDEITTISTATENGAATAESAAASGSQTSGPAGEVANTVQQCAQDVNCIKSGGLNNKIVAILNKAYNTTLAKKALANFSLAYAILVPLCLMFQASIQNSGPIITNNTQASERTATSLNAAMDQQEAGEAADGTKVVNGAAIGGLADNLTSTSPDNDLSNSIPELAAANKPYSTSDINGPETGGGGQVAYSNIFTKYLPSALATSFSTIATPTCDVFANPWSGLVLGIAQLGSAIIPGLGEIVEGGGQVTAKAIASQLADKLGTLSSNFLSKKELLKLGTITGVTVAGSILAKDVASEAAGTQTNGTETGAALANTAYIGNKVLAGDFDRQQNYAVPLTSDQIQQLQNQNGTAMAQSNQSASVYQRYLALHNPSSLLNNLAVSFALHARLGTFSSLASSTIAQILNPMQSIPKLFSVVWPHFASADTPYSSVDQDFGLVEFGWPVDQENDYLHDSDYGMLNNQAVMDASGMADAISAKYGKCFTEDVGTMLSSGDVQLDPDTSNVIPNAGDCSPDNLGMHNCTFEYQGKCDLVYRWRVMMRNNTGLDEMLDTQNPTAT